MLPLSLQSSPLPLPGIAGTAGQTGLAQTGAIQPSLAKGISSPALNTATLLPMLLQVMQGVMQLMLGVMGGGAATASKTTPAADLAPGVPGLSGGTPAALGTQPGSIAGGPNGNAIALDIPAQAINANVNNKKGVNFAKLDEQQRASLTGPGLDRFATAVIHLGGRSHTGAATDPVTGVGGTARMYTRVLANPQGFKPEEVKMIQQFADMEMRESGMLTGKYLDYAFIEQMGNRNGLSQTKMDQYKKAIDARVAQQVRFASASPQNLQLVQQQINTTFGTVSDIGQVQQITGLTQAEQAVYRLAGHSVLFSGDGTVSGDILGITYQNANALDNQGNVGSNGNLSNGTQNVNIDVDIEALAAADMADDGQVNGTSLRAANERVMDKIFLGSAGLRSDNDIIQLGQQMGLQGGRSMGDITQAIRTGGTQALADLAALAKDHTPAMLAFGGSMAAASAVCPFFGGLAAGSAGVGAGAAQGK